MSASTPGDILHVSSHCLPSVVCLCLSRTPSTGSGPPSAGVTSSYLNISAKTLFSDKITFTDTGSFGGHNVTHNKAGYSRNQDPQGAHSQRL